MKNIYNVDLISIKFISITDENGSFDFDEINQKDTKVTLYGHVFSSSSYLRLGYFTLTMSSFYWSC